MTWFIRYPCCWYLIYNNRSICKLHFCALCDTYGIKRKPTIGMNPQANAILEHIHVVVMNMLHTAEIDMVNSVKPSDIDIFLSDTAWAICSTYHTVLIASPGAATFGWDMLFDVPFIADWTKLENIAATNQSYYHLQKWGLDWLCLPSWSKSTCKIWWRPPQGHLHQSIQTEQSGFNAKTNLKRWISGE